MAGRILIADDVATNRIILKVKLATSRYEVLQADSVSALLQQARASHPDLIIIAQFLPSGGVKAACAAIHADPELAGIPIIAITPSHNQIDRLAALRAGADEVLSKPMDEDVLHAFVRNLVRTRATFNELSRKQLVAREFGFSDMAASFSRQARIALVPNRREVGFVWRAGLVGHLADQIKVMTKAEALDITSEQETPDIFVVSACLEHGSDGLHFVSALRSCPEKRHSVVIVHNPTGDGNLTIMALDMGANAVLSGEFDNKELRLRLRQLTPRKLETDALRKSLDQQLSMAMKDPLTGLYNRRYAQSYLSRIMQTARAQRLPFTLMILDLDRFKRVNDRYGHAIGDEVLVEVAARLKANLRNVDLLARLGGEEFLVALPETDHIEAAHAAERLRRVVSDLPIRSSSRGIDVPITLSIGVFVSTENHDTGIRIDQMIDRADRALYASKTEGRNQVTFVRNAA